MNPEEFEAEARRHHAARVERIQRMTSEETQACAKFMMDGYLQRAASLRTNELFTVEDLELQIERCVEIWRTDNYQSTEEYQSERERLVQEDADRKKTERERWAKHQAAHRNARTRWIDQGNDPSILPTDEEIYRRWVKEGGDPSVWRPAPEEAEPPAFAREPETAQDFYHWQGLGKPNVLSVPGGLPNKFRYPEGATDEEMWDFYWTKRDFLQSGLSWNSPMGRRLGNEHLNVARLIEQAVRERREAEEFEAEVPAEMSQDEVLAGIDAAIEFHETKTRLQRNIRQWQDIRAAIVAAEASPALKAQVERAAAGARPGAKYYALWMAVLSRFRMM